MHHCRRMTGCSYTDLSLQEPVQKYFSSVCVCYKVLGPVSQKNLKSSSDLKHGKDNGYQGDW